MYFGKFKCNKCNKFLAMFMSIVIFMSIFPPVPLFANDTNILTEIEDIILPEEDNIIIDDTIAITEDEDNLFNDILVDGLPMLFSENSITSIKIENVKGAIYTNEPKTLKLLDGSNESANWSSSNELIATVDANGIVTGISSGIATITAAHKDLGVKDEIPVKIITPKNTSDFFPNGSFTATATDTVNEIWLNGKPENWVSANIEKNAVGGKFLGSHDTEDYIADGQSLKMKLKDFKDGYMIGRIFSKEYNFEKDQEYIISGWYKTSGLTKIGANYGIIRISESYWDGSKLNSSFQGILEMKQTTEWTYFETVYTVKNTLNKKDTEKLEVVVQLTNNSKNIPSMSGTIWIDDFRISPKSESPIETIKIENVKGAIYTNEPKTLNLLVGSNESANWSSSNESIATVDASGIVTGISSGVATITAVHKDHGGKDEILVKIITPKNASEFFPNGSFTETISGEKIWVDGKPEDWVSANVETSAGNDKFLGYHDTEDYIADGQSLKMKLNGFKNGYMIGRIFGKEYNFKKDQKYIISGWYKTSGLTKTGADYGLIRIAESYWDGSKLNSLSQEILKMNATTEWTYFETDYTVKNTLNKNDTERLDVVVQLTNNSGTTTPMSGTIWIDDFRISPKVEVLPTGISIQSETDELLIGDKITLKTIFSPEDTTAKSIMWTSSDESIATVDNKGVVTAVALGDFTITAKSIAIPTVLDSIKLKVTNQITIKPLEIVIDGGVLLRPFIKPVNLNSEMVWESSDVSVATVNGGLVLGLSPGKTIITVTAGDKKAQCEITVIEPTLDDFDLLRMKYRNTLLPYEYDLSNPITKGVIDNSATKTKNYMEKITFEPGKKLWEDVNLTTSEEWTDFHRYLYTMSFAFLADGSELQYDPILLANIMDGLDWMYDNLFTLTPTFNISNWWHRDIGMPLRVTEICTLLYDFFPEEFTNKHLERVRIFNPEPSIKVTGGNAIVANRIDKCTIVMVDGLLRKDIKSIQLVRDQLFGKGANTIDDYKTDGNGYYYDGSMIEHEKTPYAMSYGLVTVTGISTIFYILRDTKINGTKIEFDPVYVDRVYKYLDDSFISLIFNGMAMDDAAGRSISRKGSSTLGRGASVLNALSLLADTSEKKDEYMGYVKNWVINNSAAINSSNIFYNLRNEKLIADDSIQAKQQPSSMLSMNRMARAYYRTDNFMYSIAMNNFRIGPHESINAENLHGMHTSDGMTMLYTNPDSFNGNYWATVDMKRLPGTTVDSRPFKEFVQYVSGNPSRPNTANNSKHRWAGSANLNGYGAAGFAIDMSGANSGAKGKLDMDLLANKSWFTFGDKIIAIGSNITSTKGRTIETTIENRKLKDDNSNQLIVDGNQVSSLQEFLGAKWAYLDDTDGKSGIGYYFPNGQDIKAQKIISEGSWFNVNYQHSKDSVSDNYAQIYVDHGIKPTSKTYSYVVLPGKTAEETNAYAQAPDFEILAQQDKLHAVKDNGLGMIAINNFNNSPVTVEDITISTTASVMLQDMGEGVHQIAIMEPTVENDTVVVTINRKLDSNFEIVKDNNISVMDGENNTTIITVTKTKAAATAQNSWKATFKFDTPEIPVKPALVSSISADVTALSSHGGTVKISIIGENFNDSTVINLSDTSGEKLNATIINATTATLNIELPENKTYEPIIYKYDLFVDNVKTTFNIEILVNIPEIPVKPALVSSISADVTALSSHGGTVKISIIGENFNDSTVINLSDTSGEKLNATIINATTATLNIELPENKTYEPIIYKYDLFVDNVKTTFNIEILVKGKPEELPNITSITINKNIFEHSGGEAVLTVTGNNLDKAKLNLDNISQPFDIITPTKATLKVIILPNSNNVIYNGKLQLYVNEVLSLGHSVEYFVAAKPISPTPTDDNNTLVHDNDNSTNYGIIKDTNKDASKDDNKDTSVSKIITNEDIPLGEIIINPNFIVSLDGSINLIADNNFKYFDIISNKDINPNSQITRAEVAKIMFNLFSNVNNKEDLSNINFSDVNNDTQYVYAIKYISKMKLFSGFPDGSFKPNEGLTRAQAVFFLSKFVKKQNIVNTSFSDISKHWAENEILSFASAGLTSGYPDKTFKPDEFITIAEFITFLNRVLGRNTLDIKTDDFTDLFENISPKHWAYKEIISVVK